MGVLVNRRLSGAAALALILIAGLSCSDKSVTGPDGLTTNGLSADDNRVIATVQVTLASSTIDVSQTTQATVVFLDKYGRVLKRTVVWSTSDPAIATVDTSGLVTARAPGTVSVIATHNSHSGSAQLTVNGAVSTAPVASVSVTLASSSLNPGQTTQASATLRDANNNVLSGRAIAWSSSNTAVATVSSTGLVAAIAAGTAQITATSEGQSASAALSVQDLPPPSVAGTFNEPTGMTVITDRAFNKLNEDVLWTDENPAKIALDAGAPRSPTTVWRAVFPAGFAGGSGPANSWLEFSPHPRVAYIRWYFKYSSNWYGNPTGINKMFYVWTNASVPSVVIEASGAGTAALKLRIAGQDIVKGGSGYGDAQNPDWPQNLAPSFVISRGAWHTGELLLVGNTSGQANGSFDAWIDGVHVTGLAGIQFVPGNALWGNMNMDPVWGGVGGTVPALQTWDVDHFYMSGKN